MSNKLNSALLDKAVTDILAFSSGETITKAGEELKGKKRNFVETVECQITLKNYDPTREKRFSEPSSSPPSPPQPQVLRPR